MENSESIENAGESTVDYLISHFNEFMAIVHQGNALQSDLEKAILSIAESGRANEIEEFLYEIAQSASLCADRAAAIEALGYLPNEKLEFFLIDLLREETSSLVQGIIIQMMAERHFTSCLLLIRNIRAQNTKKKEDFYLEEICLEAIEILTP